MSPKVYKLLIAVLLCISAVEVAWLATQKIKIRHQQGRFLQAKERVQKLHASESNAILAKIDARQSAENIIQGMPINLSAYVNSPLTNSFVPKNITDNNLVELGEGLQTRGSVRFDVKGSLQLSGSDLVTFSKTSFPTQINGIKISATCEKLHILHGSYFVKQLGETIAKLVLHYDDGTTKEIAIVTGKHVLDWWAPNYETGVPKKWRKVTAPGSELAWVGRNAYIRRKHPRLSLHLFKSTFKNPQPNKQIVSMDYVATAPASAPFLLGLTLEQTNESPSKP